MKYAIRAHDLHTNDLEDLILQLKIHLLDAVQLVCYKSFADIHYQENSITEERMSVIASRLKENKLDVAILGAYFNPVHENKELVAKGINIFKEYLTQALKFDNAYVGTETGSYNNDSWTYHPLNRTDKAQKEVVEVFREIARFSEKLGANFALEGAAGHVCYNPFVLKKVIDEIKSPNLYVIVDIVNYLDLSNHEDHLQIFTDSINLFQDRIIAFHIKDYQLLNGKIKRCSIGEGLVKYPEIMKLLLERYPNTTLVLEGIEGENIDKSLNYLKSLTRQI